MFHLMYEFVEEVCFPLAFVYSRCSLAAPVRPEFRDCGRHCDVDRPVRAEARQSGNRLL